MPLPQENISCGFSCALLWIGWTKIVLWLFVCAYKKRTPPYFPYYIPPRLLPDSFCMHGRQKSVKELFFTFTVPLSFFVSIIRPCFVLPLPRLFFPCPIFFPLLCALFLFLRPLLFRFSPRPPALCIPFSLLLLGYTLSFPFPIPLSRVFRFSFPP